MEELKLDDGMYPVMTNGDNIKKPLVIEMCEEKYTKVLTLFKHLTLISNIQFSFQVPYISAVIDRSNPYNRKEVKDKFMVELYDFEEGYEAVGTNTEKQHYEIHESKNTIPILTSSDKKEEMIIDKEDGCVVYEQMIEKLNQLPWRRMLVNFRTNSPNVHMFMIGDFTRKKLFKNWGNEDVAEYLLRVGRMLKTDIQKANEK